MSGFGLVLGGGGARGAYEVGVWKALRELDIPIDTVVGTSVGALNGAIIIQDDYDLAYKLWTSISIESVIKVEKEIAVVEGDKRKNIDILTIIKNTIASGGLDITPLRELLSRVIDEEKIRKSPIDFGMVTFSLTDFSPLKLFKRDIPEGKLIDYLLASACLPSFKPQEIGDKKFIDGGVYDNLPISLAVDKKIKNIISVDINGPGLTRRVDEKSTNIISIKNPEELTGGLLDFSGNKSKAYIDLGYYDALRTFGKLRGSKYYLLPNKDFESNNDIYIQSLDIEDLKKMYSFLGIDRTSKNTGNNKFIIDRIMRIINQYADDKLDGSTIFPAMAEIAAEQLSIDKIKLYGLNELVDEIIKEYENIRTSKGFDEYIKGLKSLTIIRNQLEFDKEIRKTTIQGKFIAAFNPSIDESDEKVKRFRKFIALAFPKIMICNMFIALVLSKKNKL
jgi:NTE family protein